MENEILVSVKELSRSYGELFAIENVSFDIHRGEILGFLGPNGAGKSTTMQLICGVLAANHGSVNVAGHDIQEAPRKAKEHLGFLPEQPPLYDDLTIDEYLNYAGKLRGIKKDAIAEAVSISKQRCGLENAGSRLIQNLSKGYKQRVGIAQAIIHSPSVIILDEPTSGLDPIQIIEIRELMLELAEDHSVIISTHILSEIQHLCDRVLIINQGKIVLDRTLEQLHNESNKTDHIYVALRNPPALEKLLNIKGVASVEKSDKNILRINFTEKIDATDAVVEKAATEKWGLYKLNPGDASLETIFMRLTQGENEPVQKENNEDDS